MIFIVNIYAVSHAFPIYYLLNNKFLILNGKIYFNLKEIINR